MQVKTLDTVGDVRGKYVIVRGSLNLPMTDGVVTDDFRLQRLLPTLEFLHDAGAKVVLIGHLSKPGVGLKPVGEELSKYFATIWGGRITSEECKEKHNALLDGEILLVEDLRLDEREKANDPAFAALIASFGELYVNEAFDNAHREHASMVGVPEILPAVAGINFAREIEELNRVLKPESPSLFLLGGAKFDTKLPLIEKHLDIYDHLFVGGALANDLLHARGYPVGQSLLSDTTLPDAIVNHSKILTPIDVAVESEHEVRICSPEEVKENEVIKDAGPETVDMLAEYITDAECVLWNGPFGLFENGFEKATEEVAKLVAASQAYSVLGGGDTIAAIAPLDIDEQFDFLSTGGGAMLTYLEQGSTKAIDLLKA